MRFKSTNCQVFFKLIEKEATWSLSKIMLRVRKTKYMLGSLFGKQILSTEIQDSKVLCKPVYYFTTDITLKKMPSNVNRLLTAFYSINM